jgi:hypothetical protein
MGACTSIVIFSFDGRLIIYNAPSNPRPQVMSSDSSFDADAFISSNTCFGAGFWGRYCALPPTEGGALQILILSRIEALNPPSYPEIVDFMNESGLHASKRFQSLRLTRESTGALEHWSSFEISLSMSHLPKAVSCLSQGLLIGNVRASS